jgi:cell division protein FtsN
MNRMDRKNNSRSSKEKKKSKINMLFIILPLLSIIIGFVAVRFVMIPRFQSVYQERAKKIEEFNKEKEKKNIEIQESGDNDENVIVRPESVEDDNNTVEKPETENQIETGKETGSSSEEIDLENLTINKESSRIVLADNTYYALQVASFKEMANANKMKEEMNKKGIPALIQDDGAMKRVFAGVFNDSESGKAILETVKKEYPDAYLSKRTIVPMLSSTTIIGNTDIDKVKDGVNNIQKEIYKISSILEGKSSFEVSGKLLSEAMETSDSVIVENFQNIEILGDGQEVDKKFTDYQNECMKILQKVKKLDENQWIEAWEYYMNLRIVYNKLT